MNMSRAALPDEIASQILPDMTTKQRRNVVRYLPSITVVWNNKYQKLTTKQKKTKQID